MKKDNIIDRIFSLASIFLILLIPSIIIVITDFSRCPADICKLWIPGYSVLFFFPSYVIEILVFFVVNFIVGRFIKAYKLALIFSGIILIMIFFNGLDIDFEASLANSTNNIAFCKMITYSNIKNRCISFIASKTLNEALCEDSDADFKEKCLNNMEWVYKKVAHDRKDSSLCDKTGEERSNCYFDLAELTQNSTLCEKLSNSSPLHTKDLCYLNLAKVTRNPELCNKMEVTPNLMDECLYESKLTK